MPCCSLDIQTSEFGYHLISELIAMEDRVLAKKIELDIWANSSEPRHSRLSAYIDALKESEDEGEFQTMAAEIVKRSDIDFHISENGIVLDVSPVVIAKTKIN